MKVFLLQAYISVYKFDTICISKIYLDTSITSEDGNLEILGCILMQPDHPSSSKRGGVCIYYKSALPLRFLNIYYLQESVSFKLKIGDELCNFISLYRSPSRHKMNLKNFLRIWKEI